MEQYKFDESNGLWYKRSGDYYLPLLALPPQEDKPIGVWGQRHLRYIRQNKRALYTSLKMAGTLNNYLADIDEQAEEMFSRLVKNLPKKKELQKNSRQRVRWSGYGG